VGPSKLATSDAELVRDALAGAKEPMGELLRRHWDMAAVLAARVLGSPDLARDAAQEAAVAAMPDLARLRSPDRFGAWFCGIALNVSRRWRRQLRGEVFGPKLDVASPDPGPAEAAEAADIAARVRAAIADLPDGQRVAVWHFYLQGLTHREIAAELGISVGAVKARLHQARAALAPVLAEMSDHQKGTPMVVTDTIHWSEVTVTEIRRGQGEDPWQRQHVMILQERDGDRTLPIWIGPAEASPMALALESVESPRPFTAKLAASLVEAASARIEEVRITRLIDGVFYATVLVDGPGGPHEVDARPSDAVNLALASGRPIRVDPSLFEAETPDKDAEKLATFPVATAEIAAETQQRHRAKP
jgi:RNA polymerase sigma factor (sigma-70 family)